MQVFLTGATGYVGAAVLRQLVADGHQVLGLARSERSARAVEEAGAEAVRGDLADLDVLTASAARADAVVHTAVIWEISDEADAIELAAVRALLKGAAHKETAHQKNGGKPFVYTSTGLVYGFDPEASRDEDAVLPEVSAQPVKAAAERLVLGDAGVAGMVMRVSLVYGRGGSGLVTSLIQAAAGAGAAYYVGDGDSTWTPVHLDDVARLYVAALERPVPGIYNVSGSSPFTFRELAEAIAVLTGTRAVSVPAGEAEGVMGPFARITATPSRMGAEKARSTFAWEPDGVALVDDVRTGSYKA